MNLGEKLHRNRVELEGAKTQAEAKERAKKAAECARKEKAIREFLDTTKKLIVNNIEAGNDIRRYPISSRFRYENGFSLGTSKWNPMTHPSIWNEFVQWGRENGLNVTAEHDHDGGGMDSWDVIVIAPATPFDKGIPPNADERRDLYERGFTVVPGQSELQRRK